MNDRVLAIQLSLFSDFQHYDTSTSFNLSVKNQNFFPSVFHLFGQFKLKRVSVCHGWRTMGHILKHGAQES